VVAAGPARHCTVIQPGDRSCARTVPVLHYDHVRCGAGERPNMRPKNAIVAVVSSIGLMAAALTVGPAHAEPVELPNAEPTPVPGTADRTDATYTDSRGVVHYKFDPATLPGHKLATDRGRKGEDGCVFSASGSGSPSAEPRVTRMTEVKFDPASCTRTLAVATYAVSKLPASVRKSLGEDPGAAPGATGGANPGALAAASYSGYLRAKVEDPPDLTVSSTRSRIYWTATSSCVTSSTRSPYWYWLKPTGWSRISGTILSNGTNCSHAYLNIAGRFKNDAFCPGSGNTTYTNHSKTLFEGRPNGRYYWSYSMLKSGGCSSLLSYDYDLSHP
jgi:hypothetical protein